MIIDTHIHLFDKKYEDELHEIINEAFDNDVKKMIIVGYDYQSSLKAIELANKYDQFFAAVGLHPSEVVKETDDELSWLSPLIAHPKVIAIGEIGLDYYWDKSHKQKQIEMFIKQINFANANNLPVIIHNRDATLDTYHILKNHQTKGVLHCYSGSVEMAREFVKMGYYLGIGGVLTFKRRGLNF